MKVQYNSDPMYVEHIKQLLEANDGYCPCRLNRTPDTKCMCKEFRDQIQDPDWYGECHCGLWVKVAT